MTTVNVPKPFYLDEYIQSQNESQDNGQVANNSSQSMLEGFYRLCEMVEHAFMQDWLANEQTDTKKSEELLRRQRNAIIGNTSEVNFFKSSIYDFLKRTGLQNEWHPRWYPDLVTAVFEEVWGKKGLYEWMTMPNSQSAKIIGSRIFFMENGKMTKKEQTISKEKLDQLINALLLPWPKENRTKDSYEIYMLDGSRIKIYLEEYAKETTIIFRKYTVDIYSFREQAARNTIPAEAIPLYRAMIDIGFNVAFIGPPRSAKTTFLATWQSYEDPDLEGIMIETDPEIPLHKIMPNAPIVQLVADDEKFKQIIKDLKRSDGDYLVMAEARDGVALKAALDVTKMGTRRVKMTYHTSDPIDFSYDVGLEIVQTYGGSVLSTAIQVAKGFHYLFEFYQLDDKSQKRLKGIYEQRFNPEDLSITVHQICKYDERNHAWQFAYDIGQDKIDIGTRENPEALQIMISELKKLAAMWPLEGKNVFEMPHLKLRS